MTAKTPQKKSHRVTSLEKRVTSLEPLPEDVLRAATGGLTFTFKLVAVKTISWAHDD